MGKRSQRDIDISTNASEPALGWRGNVILWLVVFSAVMVIFSLNAAFDLSLWWVVPAVALWMVVVFFSAIAWRMVVRRGLFTWMRAARQPAKWMARGDAATASVVKHLAFNVRPFVNSPLFHWPAARLRL